MRKYRGTSFRSLRQDTLQPFIFYLSPLRCVLEIQHLAGGRGGYAASDEGMQWRPQLPPEFLQLFLVGL